MTGLLVNDELGRLCVAAHTQFKALVSHFLEELRKANKILLGWACFPTEI